jgi:MFS family permease
MSWSRRFGADVLNTRRIRTTGMLRAMKHRNYKIFFVGEMISITGLWMQRVAMGWLVYRLTDSAFMLGAVDFAGLVPVFLLGIFTGVFLEKMDLRKVIFLCQFLSMVHAFTLAFLTLSGLVEYWHIIILSSLLGIVNAYEVPARQAFVVRLVDKGEDLGNAIALNSSLFNLARLVGPSLGGIAIAVFGEGICFILNGISYSATLTALMLLRLSRHVTASGKERSFFRDLGEGFSYVRTYIPVRNCLMTLVVISLAGIPYIVLLPVFARNILQGGAEVLGFLMAASGLGALAASIGLAMKRSPLEMGKTMAVSVTFFGLFIGIFSFSTYFPLSLLLMVFVGFFLVSSMVSCNTYIQSLVDNDKRSRVMSFYTFSVMGIAPAGSLLFGIVASVAGAPVTFAAGGILCITAGIFLWRQGNTMQKEAEPVLRAKGYL